MPTSSYSYIYTTYTFSLGNLGSNDLEQVFELVHNVRSKWYSIGVELRLEASNLDTIKLECSNPEECLYQMLRHWLKQLPPPTMREMIEALSSEPIGEEHLSSLLQRRIYGGDM